MSAIKSTYRWVTGPTKTRPAIHEPRGVVYGQYVDLDQIKEGGTLKVRCWAKAVPADKSPDTFLAEMEQLFPKHEKNNSEFKPSELGSL